MTWQGLLVLCCALVLTGLSGFTECGRGPISSSVRSSTVLRCAALSVSSAVEMACDAANTATVGSCTFTNTGYAGSVLRLDGGRITLDGRYAATLVQGAVPIGFRFEQVDYDGDGRFDGVLDHSGTCVLVGSAGALIGSLSHD